MSGGGDGERPRRSWREIDRLRDGAARREPRAPRSPEAQARARAATREYLAQAEDRLFGARGAGPDAELADAVRDAHGTPELAAACRAYLGAAGAPSDASLAAVFLDAGASDVVLAALGALEALRRDGHLATSPGLRSQLRMLADGPDDDVAEAAEALLR